MTDSETRASHRSPWTPVALAALDVAESDVYAGSVEIVLLPADGGGPIGLIGAGAAVWRRLSTTRDAVLSASDEQIALELEAAGFLSRSKSPRHPLIDLRPPILTSPVHELVYALVARVADDLGIPHVFVKGPMLQRQGLRDREHSGDVDVWCAPSRWDDLAEALTHHGWTREPDPWRGTDVGHSVTLNAPAWGCQIDVHRRMPGVVLDDSAAFAALSSDTVLEIHAGVPVRFPARESHAVVAALHAARPQIGRPTLPAHPSTSALELLRRADDPVGAAVRLGAVPALRRELRACRPEADLPADDRPPRDWFWRAQPDRARAYLTALRELPWSSRARLLVTLVWPTADVIRESARRAGDPTGSLAVARLRRLRRGLGPLLSGMIPRRPAEGGARLSTRRRYRT
ncbi:hypothetical protein AB1K56_03775 [Microbacterium sp. BWR-S6Y]|uniref:hypothetical protein n=1 Tax=Microbacterium sp. BWR-S6Y TaxID=3232073 RepID=UPI003526EAE5